MSFGFHVLWVGVPALFAIIGAIAAISGGPEYADGWLAFGIFGAVALGASLYIGHVDKKAAERKANRHNFDPPASLLILWQADTLSTGTSGFPIQWGSLLLVGTIIAVLVLIVYFGVKAAKKRKARETPPATLGKPQR